MGDITRRISVAALAFIGGLIILTSVVTCNVTKSSLRKQINTEVTKTISSLETTIDSLKGKIQEPDTIIIVNTEYKDSIQYIIKPDVKYILTEIKDTIYIAETKDTFNIYRDTTNTSEYSAINTIAVDGKLVYHRQEIATIPTIIKEVTIKTDSVFITKTIERDIRKDMGFFIGTVTDVFPETNDFQQNVVLQADLGVLSFQASKSLTNKKNFSIGMLIDIQDGFKAIFKKRNKTK